MKRMIFAAVALVGLAIAAVAATPEPVTGVPSVTPPAPAPAKLIVHEWGTFTGLAGSDGVHLPFNITIGYDLPSFVDNRQRHEIARTPQPLLELAFRKSDGLAALQRMETPIVYFYADQPMDVSVRVDFPPALLTEFYPPVVALGPAYGTGLGEYPLQREPAKPVQRVTAETQAGPSFLDWGKLRIIPAPSGDQGALIPAVKPDERYGFARRTDAALVQMTAPDGKLHEEKFLFYRGLGNFNLPVKLIARGRDRFDLVNEGPQPIATAFIMHTEAGAGGPSRFARYTNLQSRHQLALPPAGSGGDVAEQIVGALIAEGLYEKEARAMLDTWNSTWLGEAGTRLLYFVPRPVTDELLPLRVSPAPTEVVRVLVGRIDIATPELETRLQAMLGAVSTHGAAGLSDADVAELKSLGQRVHPLIERAGKLRSRKEAATLVDAMHRRPVAARAN